MLSDGEVGPIRRGVRRILRRIVAQFDNETERVIWIVVGAALKQRVLTLAVVSGNFFAAIFEGGSLGVLALAVTIITDPSGSENLHKLGSLGDFVAPWLKSLGREGAFLTLVSLAIVSQMLRAALQFGATCASVYLTTRTQLELQKTLIRHINSMTYQEVSRYPAGSFAAYMSKTAIVANLLLTINQTILNLMLCLAYIILMFWISWKIALAAVVVVSIFTALASIVIRRIKELGRLFANLSIRLSKDTMEYLQAPRLIRIFNKEDQVIQYWAEIVKDQVTVQKKAQLLKNVLGPALDVLTITLSGVIIIGGYYLFQNIQDQILSVLLAFVVVLHRMMARISTLNKLRSNVSHLMPSAQMLAEILRTDNKEMMRVGGSQVPEISSRLTVQKMYFRYRNEKRNALADISFEVPRGRTIAIVGPSGSGKTTLLDIILGLYMPSEGDVKIDNMSLRDADVDSWRRQFCVVDQDPFFFNRSVRDNLLFIKPDATEEELYHALGKAYIRDTIDSLPAQLDTNIGDRGYRLSGGQLQRLAVARAFLADANIVVFDEATSALDSVSESFIKKAVKEMEGRKTMIMVAHRLSTVADSDAIIVLKEGSVCGSGSHEELLSSCPEYKELWDLQTQAGTAEPYVELRKMD